MDISQNLGLPYIMPQQAQKHVSHNEAIQMLDAIVQLSVISNSTSSPPDEPQNGDRYIIPDTATGAWAGQELKIAAYQENTWAFFMPQPGWFAWVESISNHVTWDGETWRAQEQAGGKALDRLGINANADTQNRLIVKSDAILFSQDDVTPGNGDIQTVLNKATETNTASFLFQDSFSGKAEIGLVGDNNLSFKTSADGSTFDNSMVIDTQESRVGIGTNQPQAPLHIQGDIACLSLENSLDTGSIWTIAPGRPGLFEDHLIITYGQNISAIEEHRLRIPKNGSPEFLKGLRIKDNETVGSNSSKALAYYSPFNGSNRGEMSFRGAIDSGEAEFRLIGYYHDGSFNQVKAGTWLVNDTGARLGIGVSAPKCALHLDGAARVGSYEISALPSASSDGEGAIIFVSNESGGPTLAFSDGTHWKRVSDNQIVS